MAASAKACRLGGDASSAGAAHAAPHQRPALDLLRQHRQARHARRAGQHAQRAQHRDQLPVIARPGVAGQRPLDHGRQRRRRALRVPERAQQLAQVRPLAQRPASPCIRRCGNTGPAAPAHPRPRAPAGDAWRTAARNPPAPAAPAQRRYLALLQHAQQARLQASGMSPISSRNSTPPCACRSSPAALAARAGEPRLHSRRVRIRSGFQAAPRSSPPRTARRRRRAHLAREHFLARAGFALQQNGDAGIHQVHRSTQRVQRRRVQADGGWRGRDGAG